MWLGAAKVVLVAAITALALLPTGQFRSTTTAVDPLTEQLQHMMERHECSHSGFAEGVIPGSALITVEVDGERQLRRVDFATGWDVHNGREPGSLVAVCLSVKPERATTAAS